MSEAVKELIRRALTAPSPAQPFRQASSAMGGSSLSLDDVAGLLDVLDGPAAE